MNLSVSIVTRTLGRPCLAEAAASVRAQTHRPLEWIVVDAAGTDLAPPDAGEVPVKVVGTGRRLYRSAAANLGLRAATGDYLLILDDDDLLQPDHIAGLASVLAANPGARVVYSDVEVWTGESEPGGFYAQEYSRLQLARRNLFPPLAALFDARLVREAGCRVDETLDFFEDWDFWQQLAQHATFVRSPRRTAIYRVHLSESGVLNVGTPAADPRCDDDHARILDRYAPLRTALESERDGLKRNAREATAGGDLPAAARYWSEAFAVDPYDVEILGSYGELAFRAGSHEAARLVLERAVALAPGDAAIRWNLALVLAALGLADDAAAMRARAGALDPTIGARAGALDPAIGARAGALDAATGADA